MKKIIFFLLLFSSCVQTIPEPIEEKTEVFITVQIFGEDVNQLTVTIEDQIKTGVTVSGQTKIFNFKSVSPNSLYFVEVDTNSENLQGLYLTVMSDNEVIYKNEKLHYFVKSYTKSGPLK